jgi:cyclic-di-GMP phosphodiesterase TipF (flagellum assembly factor)
MLLKAIRCDSSGRFAMTQQFAVPEPQLAATGPLREPLLEPLPEPLYVRMGDVLVILSATLVSLAGGAWLIAQLGLELSHAILAALGIYCTLLLLHVLTRRALGPTDRGEGAPMDDEGDVHWQTGGAAFEAALARQASQAPDGERSATADAPAPRSRPESWPNPLPMPEADETEAAQAFRYRPSRLPYFESGDAADAPAVAEHTERAVSVPRPAPAGALSPDLNVEVIQDLIKKLADELNGTADRDAGTGEPGLTPEAMLARSIAALDTAARAMRAAPEERLALEPPRPPELQRAPEHADLPSLDGQIAHIVEAVAAERFEVLIEPIHWLAEGRPRHYEVSMRLRMADGAAMEQADYTRAAQDSELLPYIDAARMLRAARVARRLAERGRKGSVLSAASGDSITDNGFLDTAAQQTALEGGRVRLMLSFSQADARAFTPAHAEALATMAEAGFGFALEDVTDLEMDFGKLKALGFEFIQLDAEVFLEGMQAPGGCIPAADICRYLSEFGLTLIVGAIEDDWLLAKVMGFGVLLGKGTLFGGPRLIKAMEPGSAAA